MQGLGCKDRDSVADLMTSDLGHNLEAVISKVYGSGS